jgi:hypothetical protein
MRTMPYDNVRVSWSNISYISNLRKGMDGNYYGIISFDQYFEGIKDGKVTYRDQTRKNVEVVLKSQNMYRNGESIPVLGRVSVGHWRGIYPITKQFVN